LGPSLISVVAFAVTVGWAAPARACVTTTCAVKNPSPSCVRDENLCWTAGMPLRWTEGCVSFSVDARGIPPLGLGYEDTEALVVTSFALWPAASCADGFPSISVTNIGALRCTGVEYNPEGPNSNAVIFQTQHWSHDPVAIGVTTVSFNPDTGRIVDADIEVNLTGAGLDFLGVRYVVSHEAGHFFGLDHSKFDSALMYAQSESSDFIAPPSLDPDDVYAICADYPTYRAVGECDFEPERGFSPVCGGDLQGGCSIARRTPVRPIEPAWMVALFATSALVFRKKNARRIAR
jgi:hypothetical protein